MLLLFLFCCSYRNCVFFMTYNVSHLFFRNILPLCIVLDKISVFLSILSYPSIFTVNSARATSYFIYYISLKIVFSYLKWYYSASILLFDRYKNIFDLIGSLIESFSTISLIVYLSFNFYDVFEGMGGRHHARTHEQRLMCAVPSKAWTYNF